jgi:hypothetical protein
VTPAQAAASPEVRAIFKTKYDWDISADDQYTLLLRITPEKWLMG